MSTQEVAPSTFAEAHTTALVINRFKQGFGRVGLAISLSLTGGASLATGSEILQAQEHAAVAQTPENGPYNFNNSAVVDEAMQEVGNTYPTGWGQPGECMVAAQRWAIEANNGNDFFNYNSGVVTVWTSSGGVEVGLGSLQPGDILQRASKGSDYDTNWDKVHTLVFRGYNSDGTIKMVDSNRKLDGTVRISDSYSLATYDGWEWRAFRFGKIGNGGSGGSGGTPTQSGEVAYAAVADGQEFYSDEGWVYTKEGGAAWPIKHKNDWNGGDTSLWGNAPVGPVPTRETHDHEVGYSIDGNRSYGDHPPRDGTAVFLQGGDGQQFYFVRGEAFPINNGELDDLGARNRAVPIPQTDSRLSDFTGRAFPVVHGEVFRPAGQSRVDQFIQGPSGDYIYYVNNDTVLECQRLVYGHQAFIIPQAAVDSIFAERLDTPASCAFPPGMVLRGPGGQEQWRIEGDNVSQPYTRRYFSDSLKVYLHTSGNPNIQELQYTSAINGVTQGADMPYPEGQFFVNDANGDEFNVEDGVFRRVPWPDMNACLGNPSIIHVPGNAVGALPQGPMMGCEYDNRILVRPDGRAYYVEGGRKHPIGTPAVRDCVAVRRGTGQPVAASDAAVDGFVDSSQAYCPYETETGLYFVQEQGDSTVWFIEPNGTKRHAGSLCVSDPYSTQWKQFHVWTVPQGETAGQTQGEDWWADGTKCDALTKVWMG